MSPEHAHPVAVAPTAGRQPGPLSRWMRRRPFLSRLALFVVLPLSALAVAGWLSMRASIPVTQGRLWVPGLLAEVTVERDVLGVPQVRAATDHDAFVALGYVHAQDRLWQMDYRRRIGRGRLAEMLGVRGLASDKLMRTLGLDRAAQSAFERMPAAERAALHAYAQGVNAWLGQGHRLPPEFVWFGVQPQPWTEADSLLMIKLLAFNLGANFRDEISAQVLFRHLGSQAAAQLLDLPSEAAPATQAPGVRPNDRMPLAMLQGAAEQGFAAAGTGIGSNAWAVSGRLTATGQPMLASDPHLAQQLPSTFYLAALRGDRLDVRGATLPGVPVVVFGRNAHIAWGGTNLAADVQDLRVERLSIDRQQVEHNGRWQPLHTRDEWIDVAPDFPAALREPFRRIRYTVRSTANGPLVSDAFAHAEQPMSLRWTALDESDLSFRSFLGLNYARTPQEFRAALRDHGAPALNFVYADDAGNIGMFAAGKVPVRAAGRGVLPEPGWNDDARWLRYLDIDELPQQLNPPSGMVVSANHRIHGPEYPHLISNNWQPPYRARRIESLLQQLTAQGRKLNVDDFVRIQADVIEPQAAELLPLLLSAIPRSERQKQAIDRLRAWDQAMSEHSVPAAIYHAWSRHFMERLVADRLHVEMAAPQRLELLKQQASAFRPEFLRRVVAGELAGWCGTGEAACAGQALAALDDAMEELRKLRGSSIDNWEWGQVHSTRLAHAPLSEVPMLRPFFERREPVGGGRYTVDVSGSEFRKDVGYVKHLGSAFRQVVLFGQPGDSRFTLDAGQSGNPLDGHYDDLLKSTLDGRYNTMQPDPARSRVLVLQPEGTAH